MLDAPGHDQELALLQPDVPVPEFHPEATPDHQEELVLVLVVVPDELAQELDQLDVLAVQVPDDLRTPALVEPRELLAEIHLVHAEGLQDLAHEPTLAGRIVDRDGDALDEEPGDHGDPGRRDRLMIPGRVAVAEV